MLTSIATLQERPAGATLEPADGGHTIFLIGVASQLAADLAAQIGCFGYSVQTFAHLAALGPALARCRPAAMIVDTHLITGKSRDRAILSQIRTAGLTPVPIIFISRHDDLGTRLQAVRAQGAAYFTTPPDVSTLIDTLDRLTARRVPDPFRILIVDDDILTARRHALILKQARMLTRIVTDPLQVLGALIEFKPDLVLMDMYMPTCTGQELATVIRQQEAYVGTPIVFLSAETDIDKQLAAMRRGGDDFLTKPIPAEHLISAVTSRVQRSRIMRSFMVRDSLTGLLNHTTIKEQVAIAVARAGRDNTPLVYAILDIDHFKVVNDTYGHPCGDRVIKSLARLLQQRLRKTDLIGRYGGEEFAVLLPNTRSADAVRVLDGLRAGFAQIRQHSEGAEFCVTFSCGIASVPPLTDPVALTDTADKALYQAKHQGRNRVVLASESLAVENRQPVLHRPAE